MDPSGRRTPCKNSTFGCTFGSSSVVHMVKHFQWDCAFHTVRCFKCKRTVQKTNFEKHYMGYCKDNPAPECPAREDVPDDKGAEAITTTSPDLHFLLLGVRECTLGLERLGRVMKDIAADVAEMKALKAKQEDLEIFVKGQAYMTKELSNSITTVAEKVNKVQEDVNSVVNRLDKDAETIVQRVEKVNDVVSHFEKDVRSIVERVENVDGFMKESFREGKLSVENLSHVMNDVAADIAALKLRKEENTSVNQHSDLMKELKQTMLTHAEMVTKVHDGVETIAARVEKVHDLAKEVRVLTRSLEDQSRIHWYVKNISQKIEKSKKMMTWTESDIFVVRGYSARLLLQFCDGKTGLNVGIFLALCRGPNDSLLQWPYRIPFTLALIHPKDASKTKEHKIDPLSSSFLRSFEKPKSEKNISDGTCSLCTVEEARNEGYIEDDALCFAVTLHE